MDDLDKLFAFSAVVVPHDDPEEFEPPKYSDPGRLLFEYCPGDPDWEPLGIRPIDTEGSAFWLIEGGFCDHWVRTNTELELAGHYVLEGITGHVHRSYEGEYEEDWEFKLCRRASQSEIDTEALDD